MLSAPSTAAPSGFDYRAHFDAVAANDAGPRRVQAGFHAQAAQLLRHHIEPGRRILEVGCGRGDLLAALAPSRGLGLDLSAAMVEQARARHGHQTTLEFRVGAAPEQLPKGEQFDVILLDYLLGYVTDIQELLQQLQPLCHPRTRLYVLTLNHLWLPMLGVGTALGWVSRQPPSNWVSRTDLTNLLELAGWEVIRSGSEQLCPFRIPLLAGFGNRWLVRLPLFRHLGASVFLVARPRRRLDETGPVTCTVVVPARNEAGNIRPAIDRIPTLGPQTEVIFVEGNSKDDTWEVLQREIAAYRGPHRLKLLKQPGKGKWDAVATGFAAATGDLLVIQDADLTAPPEDLPKFYEAVVSGTAEFANGSRLVYPMEEKAMRFLNLLGNKFFASALSAVLQQPVKDSLCGTKMLRREDYQRLLARLKAWGDFDPFGDFNLLFGSAWLDLRIRDIPVRYKERTYGETNISRFKHGWMLLKMTFFGLRKLRFHK